MNIGSGLIRIALVAVLALIAAAAFVTGGPRQAIDWRAVQAVVLESDDWGLAGFVPDADAWDDLDRDALRPGRFPDIYWLSTLEDSSMVAELCALLAAHPGRDGLPAVLQPNYVLSALSRSAGDGSWHRFDLPDLQPGYDRPGLWSAVRTGIAGGTWYPEFHATWHYDPALRKSNTDRDDHARRVANRGILLFPGSERARELGSWRSLPELAAELDGSLSRFESLFGRPPNSTIAPDYSWHGGVEDMWASRGLTVIQAKREQRNAAWGHGLSGRLLKVLDRKWSQLVHPGRVYLERNCRFEPVQSPDPDKVVDVCRDEVQSAWRRRAPAIVETHRINFVHAERNVVDEGRRHLAMLLDALTPEDGVGPTYLTDHEVAQLNRAGVSWCVRGGRIVLRNPSHSRRVVTIPESARVEAARQAGVATEMRGDLLVALAPGAVNELIPGQ